MSQTAGVFFVIDNQGSMADALIRATTSICDAVELHESILEGDVMKMQPVPGGRIEIPAGQAVELKPGGLHVMLIGLHKRLVPGESFSLSLEFERAGSIEVEVEIREVGAVETNS
jgi:copper(I)-binding protein